MRKITTSDHELIRHIYVDAIQSQCSRTYSEKQIEAWSSLALLPGILEKPLSKGDGWLSYECNQPAAFAIRYPQNRVALVYCLGSFAGLGHATSLLKKLESNAINDGQNKLFTEASYLSYSLFFKLGWQVLALEKIEIAGVGFQRYRMSKKLYLAL